MALTMLVFEELKDYAKSVSKKYPNDVGMFRMLVNEKVDKIIELEKLNVTQLYKLFSYAYGLESLLNIQKKV